MESTRKCECDWCAKWFPTIKRVQDCITDKQLLKDFEDLITHFMIEEDDGDVSQAKLAGDWPGWRFMKTVTRLPDDEVKI